MLETMTLPQTEIEKTDDVSVIILLYKNPSFTGFAKPFDLEICGKKMWKWVELASCDFNIKTTLCTDDKNVLEVIKPMLTNSKITLVFFSDTPLLQKSTVKEIANFALAKGVNALKLTRGYVFNTEYARTATEIANTQVEHFGNDDFVEVFDLRQLEFVSQIMKERIIEFHQKNGVLIQDHNTTFIDADVIIEQGVKISPLNVIKGCSYIGKNTTINSGNYLYDCIIEENCVLNGAYIQNAKIAQKTVVDAFQKICGGEEK